MAMNSLLSYWEGSISREARKIAGLVFVEHKKLNSKENKTNE